MRTPLQTLAAEYIWFRYRGIRMCRGVLHRITLLKWVGADTRFYLMQATKALVKAEQLIKTDWKKEQRRLKK